MATEAATEAPIVLPEGPINEGTSFPGIRDFLEWCQQQVEFIRSVKLPGRSASPLMAHFLRPYIDLQNLANSNSLDFRAINAELSKAVFGGLLTSDSSVGQFIGMANDSVLVAGFLGRLAGWPFEKIINLSPGNYDALLRGYGAAGSLVGVDRLAGAEHDNKIAEATAKLVQVTELLEASQESVENFQQRFNTKLLSFEAEQERIKDAYHEDMALSAATEYWKEKYERHDRQSNKDMASFIKGSSVGSVVIVLVILLAFAGYVHSHQFFADLSADLHSLPIGWSVATAIFFFLPLFLFVWYLRTVLARAKMHRHYAEDAQMRSTMMVVYLALMKQDSNAVTQEERALLLNALLRPLESGQRDDGPPPGIIELLTRQPS